MKKAKKSSASVTCKEEPKPIEPRINLTLPFQKAPTFYPILTDEFSNLRKKRHIKYAGKLICPEDQKFPSKFKNLKKMSSLVINKQWSRSDGRVVAPSKFLKAFNPFKKHVKVFHEDLRPLHPSLFSHIHHLYRLKLHAYSSLLKKKVRFITNVRSLFLTFDSYNFATFFWKDKRPISYFERLMRHFASLRCLKHLRIHCEVGHDAILKIAPKLKALPSLCSSLKKFHISLESRRLSLIQEICPYVTKLSALFVHFDLETIKGLTRLEHFKFRVNGTENSISYLPLFENLENLKKLNIEVDISDQALFDGFLQKFSVPSGIESIKFNISSIYLKHIIRKIPLKSFKNFPHFITKLTNLSQLKKLCLTTKDEAYGSGFIRDFAVSFLNQVKSLESLSLMNTDSGKAGETNCLDLSSIMDEINKLKDPIHDIIIKDVRISQKGFDQAVNLFKKGVFRENVGGVLPPTYFPSQDIFTTTYRISESYSSSCSPRCLVSKNPLYIQKYQVPEKLLYI